MLWTAAAVAVGRSNGSAAPGAETMLASGAGIFTRDGLGEAINPATSSPATLSWSAQANVESRAADWTSAFSLTDSGSEDDSSWRHVGADVRRFLDKARLGASSWRRIVVSMAGAAEGSARDLAALPRGTVHPQPAHFVVGNGSRTADGEIELGSSWATDAADDALHIVLVGDPRETGPSAEQTRAFRELAGYLQAKTGTLKVETSTVPWLSRETGKDEVSAALVPDLE